MSNTANSDGKCARCRRNPVPAGDPLCAACKQQLLGGGIPSGEKEMRVQISPIIREALDTTAPGEDVDEALLRALKRHYPEEAMGLLSVIGRIVEVEAQQAQESKEEALRRLAAQAPGPEITLKTSGASFSREWDSGEVRASSSTVTQEFIRVGDKTYDSLEEVPPHIRRAIEEAKAGKGTGRVHKTVISGPRGGGLEIRPARQAKSGCITWLLGGWIVVLWRGMWK